MLQIETNNVHFLKNIKENQIQFFIHDINDNNNIKIINKYNNQIKLKFSTLNINFNLFLNNDKTIINDITLNKNEFININIISYKTNNYILLEEITINNIKFINLKKEINYKINNTDIDNIIYVFIISSINEISEKYNNIITNKKNFLFIIKSNINKYDEINKILMINNNTLDLIYLLSKLLSYKYIYIFKGDIKNIKLNINNNKISKFYYEEIKNYIKLYKNKILKDNILNNININILIENKYLIKKNNKEIDFQNFIDESNNDIKNNFKNDNIIEIKKDDFDWVTYVNNYKDLRDAKINTKEKAYSHWKLYGKKEGRTFKNINKYKENDNLIIKNIQNNKYIIHFTHNFGGGTQTYIDNFCDIVNYNKHIVIKIKDMNNVFIDNKLIKIIDLHLYLNNFNIQLIILHHLLCINNKLTINYEIIDVISMFNTKKIFIVHDYFLFYNDNPTLNKTSKSPENKDIVFTQNLLDKFDKVYFGSKNTYDNYNKYIKLNNYIILNISPDIDIYNKRIYPPKKNNYNIGLLGNISVIHKGKNLASNIFKLFNNNNKYNFIVIGEFNESYNNVKVTGKYINDKIYDLINQYDIDYFLCVSVVEETYSFTTSICLNTGLPIIYNNIGSYINRLNNYENCYSFEEDNYEKIIDILNELDNKSLNNTIKNNNKYLLYKNLPEYDEFINTYDIIENINFSNINLNIIYNNICFIYYKNNNNTLKLLDIINYIKNSQIYEKLDYIFIILLGDHIYLPQEYKIKLIYYSNDFNKNELISIKIIRHFSYKINKNINILYINNNNDNKIDDELVKYYLINNYNLSDNNLLHYDAIGLLVNNSFLNNSWWSKSFSIRKILLDDNIETINQYILNYLIFDNYTYISLFNNNNYNYQVNIDSIKINIRNNIFKRRNIFGIFYICCLGNYMQFVNNIINILTDSKLYDFSDNIYCFICNYTNEIINKLSLYDKIIIIKTTENLYEKFAINNIKNYLNGNYDCYYIHTKGITRSGKKYDDWIDICNYFTINKWILSYELLKYYDCVGINLRYYPKIHYSGNFWWSKSEQINKLDLIDDNYLSSEMYICSNASTNYISIYQTNIYHNIKEYDKSLYINLTNDYLIDNLTKIPYFNLEDKFALNKEIVIDYKDVVLITSKIIVSNNPLSYINNRSIYSTDERFNQTINTIESIKKYLPNAYIILLDNSKIDINKINILNSSVNLFINLIDNNELDYFTNESLNKGYGELVQTKFLLKYTKNLNIKQLFKISGRYFINNTFNYKDYDNSYNIFKKNNSVTDREYYYTSFYKISRNNYNEYYYTINSLCEYIKYDRSYDELDYEVFLPKNIGNFIQIKNLGITQNISVWDQKDNI